MEKNNDELRRSSSHSWWWDSHNRCPHSQRLHTTLAELDKKIKMILDVIEDEDGDTFSKRAEMYYGKRPKLIKLVEELHRSYRALAVKYDQQQQLMLKSQAFLPDFHHKENTLLDSSQNLLHYMDDPSINNPALESENSNFEFDSSSNTLSPNSSKNPSNYKGDHVHLTSDKKKTEDGFGFGFQTEKIWTQHLQFFKLVEENLYELVRRNDEKRKLINELEKENLILRNSQSTLKVKLKAKLKGCFCFQ